MYYIYVWDTVLQKFNSSLKGHTQPIKFILVINQERLLSCCNNTLRLWDTVNGVCLHILSDGSIIGIRNIMKLEQESS